jgi:predicted dithiol-disulfide oxidoreductase (DUF899 family)
MTEHATATREEWDAARQKLLEREKELTHMNDELTKQRQELPWVRIEKDYSFETDDGSKTLAELFDGRSQLLIYHHMFGPDYTAGCPVCASVTDGLNAAVPHLNARDVTFLCVSRAPLEKLQAYKRRMGWQFPWVSSFGTEFNFDFGASRKREETESSLEGGDPGPVLEQLAEATGTDPAGYLSEGPALTAFTLADGAVFQTYSAYARGLEVLMGYYALLDRVPKGRDEEGQTEFWIRRHDEY